MFYHQINRMHNEWIVNDWNLWHSVDFSNRRPWIPSGLCTKVITKQNTLLLTPASVYKDNNTNQYYAISDVTHLIWVQPMIYSTLQ